VIAIDYGIRGRSTTLKVRRALLFYALKGDYVLYKAPRTRRCCTAT
jgi:hypothetical protein